MLLFASHHLIRSCLHFTKSKFLYFWKFAVACRVLSISLNNQKYILTSCNNLFICEKKYHDSTNTAVAKRQYPWNVKIILETIRPIATIVKLFSLPKITCCHFSFYLRSLSYIIFLARTPEIGQGLGRILSCGARKPEQTQMDLWLLWTPNHHPFSWHINTSLELSAG